MKNIYLLLLLSTFCFASCNSGNKTDETSTSAESTSTEATGQSGVKDDDSNPNVVPVSYTHLDVYKRQAYQF